MKSAILLICFISVSSAQQSDLSRSVDRVADQIAIGNIQRSQAQDQQEWDRFGNSLRRTVDSFREARLIQLQNERADRDAVALRAAAYIQPPPTVVEQKVVQPQPPQSTTGRYQLLSKGALVLKIDTVTGKTWQCIQSTNGVVSWLDVTDAQTAQRNAEKERAAALNEWEIKVCARDKVSEKQFAVFVGKAIPEFLEREKEMGRSMTTAEALACLEKLYMSDWKSSSPQQVQK